MLFLLNSLCSKTLLPPVIPQHIEESNLRTSVWIIWAHKNLLMQCHKLQFFFVSWMKCFAIFFYKKKKHKTISTGKIYNFQHYILQVCYKISHRLPVISINTIIVRFLFQLLNFNSQSLRQRYFMLNYYFFLNKPTTNIYVKAITEKSTC